MLGDILEVLMTGVEGKAQWSFEDILGLHTVAEELPCLIPGQSKSVIFNSSNV